jgi:putative SOS response-associated peptidase YedK
MINAQSETWQHQAITSCRCLVVADGFYEWPEKNKLRLITLKDNEPFAFAGVWDRWQPNGGEKLEAFSILTCPPNEFMAGHDLRTYTGVCRIGQKNENERFSGPARDCRQG